MKLRWKILIGVAVLLVVCVLLLIVFPKGVLSERHAELLFKLYRPRFEAAAAQTLEQGNTEGVSVPGGSDIDLYETHAGCVDFCMGGFGLVPATLYMGIVYTTEDVPLGFQGLAVDYIWDGEGWYWQEENSDNCSYVTKLDDHWYLYKMWF